MSWYGSASFHAQQATEKSLKALLVRQEIAFPKTHNVEQLLQLAEPVTPGIGERLAEARTLTPYAVRVQYPGEGPLPNREQAGRHLALARKVLDEVGSLLRPYLGSSTARRPRGWPLGDDARSMPRVPERPAYSDRLPVGDAPVERLRVGVVGAGLMGERHARIYASLPDVELVAVCDTREEAARRVAAATAAAAYTDLRELLARDVEAVSVCTSDAMRFSHRHSL